jgi:hypothetical protein
VRRSEQPDDLTEERRRDGQVVKRMPGRAQLRPQPAERVGIVIRALDKAELALEPLKDRRIELGVGFEALPGAIAQARDVAVPGDPDDRHRPARIANQASQGGEDLLEGQIPGGAEEDKSVGGISPGTISGGVRGRSGAAGAG